MSSIFIDTSQLKQGAERFKNMSVQLEKTVDDVLSANTEEMAEKVHQNIATKALSYKGLLQRYTTFDNSQHLKKRVTVGVDYASYVEFGTGAYAAAYVGSLPSNWQAFAAQFRGKTGGTFKEMVLKIQEWVRIKGFAGKDYKNVGFLIARSIIIHGVRPHPFLYPAFVAQLPILEADLDNAIKQVK